MRILLLILMLAPIIGVAQLKAPGKISRNAPTDSTYGLMDDSTITGGHMTFYRLSSRDSLPYANRRMGMTASVSFRNSSNLSLIDSTVTYQLQGGIANEFWIRLFNGPSTNIDTTSLSNRINQRVKYTDTSQMLVPFARDTGVVHKAQAETITGLKTFGQAPLLPVISVADSSLKAASTAYVQQWIYANFGKFQEKTITFTGAGQNSVTYTSLINQEVTELTRSGMGFDVITSGMPDSGQVKFTASTGLLEFGVSLRSGEKIKLRYQPTSALSAWSGGLGIIQVNTYSDVSVAASNINYVGIIVVSASGNNGGFNPSYDGIYFVNKGVINQIASYPYIN